MNGARTLVALLGALSMLSLSACGTASDTSSHLGNDVQTRPNTVQLKVGDQAPLFSLPASDGKVYDLASYRGKQAVVLAWFVKAFSEPWTAQCRSLRESGDDIRTFDVAHFAVSVDDVETNRKFAQSLNIDYALLSDADKRVATAYGVVDADQPFPSRWTFYIGVDGRILYIDKLVSPATQGEAIVKKLAELGVPRRRRS